MSPENTSESQAEITPLKTPVGIEAVVRTVRLMRLATERDNGEVPADEYDPSTDTRATDSHQVRT